MSRPRLALRLFRRFRACDYPMTTARALGEAWRMAAWWPGRCYIEPGPRTARMLEGRR